MPRLLDLTQPITPTMPVYDTHVRPAIVPWSTMAVHGFDAEAVHLSTHTGTHMDAPSHFVKGALAIEGGALERCVAPGVVLDLRGTGPRGRIGAEALRQAESRLGRTVAKGEAVLLWTGWSQRWRSKGYLSDNPGLAGDGARYLAERRVALVGVDSANLDHPEAGDFPAHHTLLGAGIPIVENLARLGAIRRAEGFTFVALPLPIVGATGSPVRALALLEG